MQDSVLRKPRRLKDLALSALSGILLALSFPKFNLEFLCWFGLIPLFFALENNSGARAFFISFICGIFFWLITICWLVHVTMPGTFVLILYLALYFGLFGLLFGIFNPSGSPASSKVKILTGQKAIFLFPAFWVLLEYARSNLLTGFPWALLGYSQYLNLPLIQIADIFGALGISFLLVMVNVGFYSAIKEKSGPAKKIKCLIVPAVILVFVFGYGFLRLGQARGLKSESNRTIKISVVQGNIAQELKWYPRAREEIMKKYLTLSQLAARENPDLIVWPEAAVPVVLEEAPEYYAAVRNLAKQVRAPILFGAVRSSSDLYYNSALMVSAEGERLGCYDKLHLVPFGEYIPLRKILPFLETIAPIGDVNPGKEYTLFSVELPGVGHSLRSKFGVLICFEDVFPELSRRFVRQGAQFLVNITNDAWYKQTFASYQHFQASVFRAVENRISLVRSANTGVSGFISPEGRSIALVQDSSARELFVDGYKTWPIPAKKGAQTIYTRFGDWLIISLCSLIVLIQIILAGKYSGKKPD